MSWQRASRASRVGRLALVVTLLAVAASIPGPSTRAQMGGQFPGIYNPAYSSGFNYGSWGGGSGMGMGGIGFGGMGYPGMGYGGMGFGGLGMGYYGGMGYGGMGMSPYDQAMVKQQFAALNTSNYNLQNAQAAAAYQQANYYRQQTENLALANAQKARALQPKYQTNTGAISTLAAAAAAPITPAATPAPKFLAQDGSVVWPDFAIKNKDRADVDRAVVKVVSEQKTGGHASVAAVAQAKQKLRDYGHPALRLDRVQSRPKLVKDLARFLNALNDYLSDAANDAKAAAPG